MSGLSAKAKPFVFNPSAGSFVPGGGSSSSASAAPSSSSSPPPGFSAPNATASPPPSASATETFDLNNADARPLTQPATDNWEDLAEDGKVQATHSIPVNTVRTTAPAAASATTNSSNHIATPAPTTVTEPAVSSSATFPDASVTAVPSQSASAVDDVTESVDELALDEEEAKELADAAEEEAVTRKPKRDDSEKKVHDEREHINIVFIGHVDAGKFIRKQHTVKRALTESVKRRMWLMRLVLLTDQVDERTMAKYEKEAKEKNRESWYLAYIMDTNEEERAKGKTVEVGRAHFTTAKKRYTLLDAPGHKNYVPNMIGGASQADVGVLVISARKGEFESGFDRGGQTREHAMLAKTLGLQKLVVLVNKMDEKEVSWRKERYDQIEAALSPFLKKCGFNMKTDVVFLPASGYTGANIKEPVSESVCPWYSSRKSLFQVLDDFPPMQRDPLGALRLPIMARYKDMGALFCLGKLESGTLYKDRRLLMMPNKVEVLCTGISVDEQEVDMARPGENVLVKVKGIEEEDVQEGFVLSYTDRPTKRSCLFEAQVAVLDLLEHKPILAVGYEAMLHVHVLTTECTLTSIVQGIDKKTGEKSDKKPRYLKSNDFATVRFRLQQSVAIETFKEHPALGRFTIRDEGKTICIGKVTQIKEEP